MSTMLHEIENDIATTVREDTNDRVRSGLSILARIIVADIVADISKKISNTKDIDITKEENSSPREKFGKRNVRCIKGKPGAHRG